MGMNMFFTILNRVKGCNFRFNDIQSYPVIYFWKGQLIRKISSLRTDFYKNLAKMVA